MIDNKLQIQVPKVVDAIYSALQVKCPSHYQVSQKIKYNIANLLLQRNLSSKQVAELCTKSAYVIVFFVFKTDIYSYSVKDVNKIKRLLIALYEARNDYK